MRVPFISKLVVVRKVVSPSMAPKLKPGQTWRQESVVGSVFEASYELRDGQICPSIRGTAYVNSDSTLVLDEADPFCWGIRS